MFDSKFWAVLLLFVSLLPNAFADENKIQGLNLDPTDFEIQIKNAGFPSQKIVAVLKGDFEGEQRSLIDADRNVVLSTLTVHSKKTFELPVTLTSSRTEVRLLAIDASGEVEKKTITVSYPDYEAEVSASGEISSLGQGWGLGIGTDFADYSQTGMNSFSEAYLDLKGSYQRPLGGNWDFAVSASIDVVPLSTGPSGTDLRFLRVNGRAGYNLLRSDRWSLSLAGGAYYTTTFASESFGFKNFFGPQLFPIVRYTLGGRDSFGLYYKYSPISSSNELSFASYEEVVGFNWTHAIPKRKTVSVSVEWIRDFVHLTDYALQCDASSIDLGVGYGF